MAKLKLGGSNAVSETLLIPLWARAVEQREPEPLLRDPKAAELVGQIDYDWSKIKLRHHDFVAIAVRARQFDRFTQGFLQRYPAATVVQLGCGLDTRFERLDNGRVTWFDLDLPDVIALRRQLLPEAGRYHYLASSAFDPGWMEVVAAAGAGPVLFVSEAVLVYFDEATVRGLFLTLQRRFPGSELVTDAATPFMAWLDNLHLIATRSSARIRWGLRDPRDPEGWSPGIQLLETFSYSDPPEPRMGMPAWMGRFRPIANGQRILRYALAQPPAA